MTHEVKPHLGMFSFILFFYMLYFHGFSSVVVVFCSWILFNAWVVREGRSKTGNEFLLEKGTLIFFNKLIKKTLNCCCGPPKSIPSKSRERFKNPGDDPGTSRGKNMKLFWGSLASEMWNKNDLQAAGLVVL